MRPAKLPAAFCWMSVNVDDELTKAAVTMPFDTSGTDEPVLPLGQPVPSGLHPAATFDCIAVKEFRIGAALI